MAVTGRKTKALHHLRTALANQSGFRTWVGAADVAEALVQIVLHRSEEADLPDRPFVLVRLSEGEHREQVATSTFAPAAIGILFIAEGAISAENQDDDQAAYDEASDDWDALRGFIEDCQGYVDGNVRLFIAALDEIVEDAVIGAILWPAEKELPAAGKPFPWWHAKMTVMVGGTGEL